jgi:chromate transport protein ChrA
VLLTFASIYSLWGEPPLLTSVPWALKPAVLAIVIQASWRVGRRTLRHPLLAAIAAGALLGLTMPLLALGDAGDWGTELAQMARFFNRVVLVSIGGGYAVLPYVAQGAVEHFGWLRAREMADGLAFAAITAAVTGVIASLALLLGRNWSVLPLIGAAALVGLARLALAAVTGAVA